MTIFWDTETHLIRPGLPFPPIVCVQWAVDREPARLLARADGPAFAAWGRQALESGHLLVGHHVSYDLGVLCAEWPELIPLVFQALRENRVTDTMWRQKLADIGRGTYRGFWSDSGAWIQLNYSLEDISKRHGWKKDHADPWRLRYAELQDVPSAHWPDDARWYALNDIDATRACYLGQQERYPAELVVDEFAQTRRFFALTLCSGWGLRTSPEGVRQFETGIQAEFDEIQAILQEAALVRANGSRDTKRAKAYMVEVMRTLNLPHRVTKTGGICLDSDACDSTGDEMLSLYAKYSSRAKVLSNDVQTLRAGMHQPIHTKFDIAKTGRTTSSKPNVQNFRRLPGVRECFVPRGAQ